MISYPSLIATKLENLPIDKQQQVLNFVEFLAQKSTLEQKDIKRVPNLHQDKIWMSDDFNEPLDDSFWLG
ncbi:MAG: DUF2281 domain-containing protein [Hydrococcus sp. SU_1_0]|nr:DUF2281 domain-containing protein [Hydrococcus sp. SU_1_0]